VIRAVGLAARAAPLQLAALTFELQGAVHAFIGAPADGVALVLAVIAGEVRPTAGVLEVLGGSPESSRRAIGYVPLDVALPNVMRVGEVLDLAAEIRGESVGDAARRLGALGVAPLVGRPVNSLSSPEMRAVAMAEAVTSRARVLLLEEPLVGLDPRASALLAARLRERAYDGACVVLSTASTRDAIDLADVLYLFDRGALVRIVRANDPLAAASAKGVRMRVRASDTRALLAALAKEKDVLDVATEKSMLVLSGESALGIAQAVARAALAEGVELEMLRLEAPSLEELRGAPSRDAGLSYPSAITRPRAAVSSAAVPHATDASLTPPTHSS
jgi:ABC-2 type transport system ATP-binding protein